MPDDKNEELGEPFDLDDDFDDSDDLLDEELGSLNLNEEDDGDTFDPFSSDFDDVDFSSSDEDEEEDDFIGSFSSPDSKDQGSHAVEPEDDEEVKDFSKKSGLSSLAEKIPKKIVALIAVVLLVSAGMFTFLGNGNEEENPSIENTQEDDSGSDSGNNENENFPKYRPVPPEDAPVKEK